MVTVQHATVQHLFCSLHMEDNVRHFLTAGVAVKERERLLATVRKLTVANTSLDCEKQVAELMEATRTTAVSCTAPDKLTTYITEKVVPKLHNNIQRMKNIKTLILQLYKGFPVAVM